MASIALVEPGPTGGPGAMGARIVEDALRRAGHTVTRLRLSASGRVSEPVQLTLFRGLTSRVWSHHDAIYLSTIYPRQWTLLSDALRACSLEPERARRSDSDPLVAIGGQTMIAPEPIADYVDVIALGDGEITAIEIASLVDRGLSRRAISEALSGRPGYYVPEHQSPPSPLVRVEMPSYWPRRLRTGESDRSVVVEVARGCRSRCAFCPIGWAGGRYREGSRDEIERIVRSSRGASVNLYAPDYSSVSWSVELDRTVEREGCMPRGRDARLDATLRKLAIGGTARSWSFGIEGLSARIRRAIGKPASDDEILDGMDTLQRHGVRNVKWYMIVGFPGETDSDLDAFLALLVRVRARYAGHLSVTLTILQPVPHTPLQWVSGHYDERARERCDRIRAHLRDLHRSDGRAWIASQPKGRDLHESDVALQRGGRSLGRILMSTRPSDYQSGAWRDRAEDLGIDLDAILAPRDPDAETAWSHVDVLTDRRTVRRAWSRYAQAMEIGDDPRAGAA